jgi:hypothetical protein
MDGNVTSYWMEKVEKHCQDVGLPIQCVFKTAYVWRFGVERNMAEEVYRYRYHAIVPQYLKEYILAKE